MNVAPRQEPYDVLLALQHPAGRPRPVTQVRSTLITASIQGLREMGWESRYYAELPPERHLEMKMMTAATWLPLEVGLTHYRACDAMRLSPEEMDRMGQSVSLRTQKSFVGTLGRAAAGAGATPWNIFVHVHRIYARMVDGGDHVVYRVGPKEALIVNFGCPLVDVPYFRTAMVSYYRTIASMLSNTVYAKPVEKYNRPLTWGVLISWV